MSKNYNLEADFKNSDNNVHVKIAMFSFRENDNFIVYTPHLEVYGYGKTEEEAFSSFNISLGEFLNYITNKKTVHKVLTGLGWTLKKGSPKHPRKIAAPIWTDLLNNNEELTRILSNQDFTKRDRDVAISI